MYKIISLIFSIMFVVLEAKHPAVVREEFIFTNPPFESCHASTITETSQGQLLCAWFAGTKEGESDVAIWLSDYKTQWSAPKEVARGENVPCWNPVLFTLPSKEILLFYKVGRNPREWTAFLKRSWDDGKSWCNAEMLPAGIIGPVRSKPLLLDGTLLCGSSIESWKCWGGYVDMTSDNGCTWNKSNPINIPNQLFGVIQPTLFHAKNGTLRMLMRSHQIGYICTSTSSDKGLTWTPAIPINLPNPNAAIDAVNLKDGRILLVFNHSKSERSPLNIAISKDGGETWEPSLVLEDAPGEYSYPAIIQTKDGLVHVTYTWNRLKIKHVVINPTDL